MHLNALSAAFRWNALQISIKSIWSNASFKIWFLIYFLGDYLSTGVSGVLKSSATILLVSISPFTTINVCLRCSYVGCLHHLFYLLVGLISWPLCVLLVFSNSLYFKVCFAWYEYYYSSFLLISVGMEYFFHSLTFSLYVSLDLKWVPFRQCIHKSLYLFSQSVSFGWTIQSIYI